MADTILLLDGDGTQTIPIAKSLHLRGDQVSIFYENRLSYGPHSRYITNKILAPSPVNESEYLEFLKAYLRKVPTDVLIPLGDDSALVLSKYKNELSGLSRFLSPDYASFHSGYDKNALMGVCAHYSFPHPTTIDLEIGSASESMYPALIKPNIMTGGRGMTMVANLQEFEEKYPAIRERYGACHLQEYIPSGGRQIKVQLLLDETGRLRCSSVIHKQRYYPENGGSSCCNTTIRSENLVEMCSKVLEKIGWVGFADFDLIEDPRDSCIKIMEINPRIPACIKSAVESGVDYGVLISDLTLGREGVTTPIYRQGKTLRHIGFEMLWFYYSSNRFKTSPNWFRFFGKNISYQDFEWLDPLPFIYGSWGNLKKLSNPDFLKAKSGLR